MRRLVLGSLVLWGMAAANSVGQSGTGTVTGHVVCSDTQRPARFDRVILMAVPVAGIPDPGKEASAAAVQAYMESSVGEMRIVETLTDADGSYSATGVGLGDWYVFAWVPGYVQPMGLVEEAVAAGEDVHKSIAGAPRVHVTPGHVSMADLSVPRGAAISGHVRWDDGSPVTGGTVNLLSVSRKQEAEIPGEFARLRMSDGWEKHTDDLGAFRISGLEPGDYVVEVKVITRSGYALKGSLMKTTSANTLAWLQVFAPAAFRQTDAKAVTLRAGEERGDVDVLFSLNGLHTVSGTVTSAEDHHRLNAGVVLLRDEKDKDFKRTAGVDENGGFMLTFVPPGTYTLTVRAADEGPSKKKYEGLLSLEENERLRSYEDGKITVVVGDSALTGQDYKLKPATTAKPKQEFNQLLFDAPPQ
jgi:hypothetical protein